MVRDAVARGAVNGLLGHLGVAPLPFLTEVTFAKASVILTIVWAHFGFNMILFLAGIKSVPTEFYEPPPSTAPRSGSSSAT